MRAGLRLHVEEPSAPVAEEPEYDEVAEMHARIAEAEAAHAAEAEAAVCGACRASGARCRAALVPPALKPRSKPRPPRSKSRQLPSKTWPTRQICRSQRPKCTPRPSRRCPPAGKSSFRDGAGTGVPKSRPGARKPRRKFSRTKRILWSSRKRRLSPPPTWQQRLRRKWPPMRRRPHGILDRHFDMAVGEQPVAEHHEPAAAMLSEQAHSVAMTGSRAGTRPHASAPGL